MGYRPIALSSSPSKRESSLEFGAIDYLDGSQVNQAEELQKIGGANAILACAPNADAMHALVDGLAPNGSLIILGVPHEDFKVSAGEPFKLIHLPMSMVLMSPYSVDCRKTFDNSWLGGRSSP